MAFIAYNTIFFRFPNHMMMIMIVFVVWLTDERRLALFPAGTIVGNPHHDESPTRHEKDLYLCRSSGFVKWSCAVEITTTPRRHKFAEIAEIHEISWNWKHLINRKMQAKKVFWCMILHSYFRNVLCKFFIKIKSN